MLLNEHVFWFAGFPSSASVEEESFNLGKQVQDYDRIKYHHDYMQQMQLAMRLAPSLMQNPNRRNANQVTVGNIIIWYRSHCLDCVCIHSILCEYVIGHQQSVTEFYACLSSYAEMDPMSAPISHGHWWTTSNGTMAIVYGLVSTMLILNTICNELQRFLRIGSNMSSATKTRVYKLLSIQAFT